MKSSLYRSIMKSVSGRLTTYIIQFISLMICARLFTVHEFGVIASIQVFIIFFQMISDIGIGPAIINEKEINKEQINGIFSCTVLIGVFISFVFYIFSFFLNSFYSGYDYQNISFLISISILFSSLNIIPKVALIKDLKFITVSVIDVISEMISFLIIYYLYILGFGVIALASKPLSLSIIRFSLSLYLSSSTSIGRPKLGLKLYHIKTIFSYSSYQFGFNFINYFSRNLDNILIAKFFGLSAAGIYDKSYQLMRYPLMLTTFALTPALQPTLTKNKSDREFIISEHNNLACRLLALTLPISMFLMTNANDIVMLLFGEKWLSVAPLIEIFSVIISIQAVLSTSGAFFQTLDRPDLLFKSGLLVALITVTTIILGVFIGDIGSVAYMVTIGYILNFIVVYYFLFKKVFESSLIYFYKILLKVIFILLPSIITYLALFFLYKSFFTYSYYINIIVTSFIGMVSLAIFRKKFINIFLKKLF